MNRSEKIQAWVEAGKQIGKAVRHERNGPPAWLSIGIQKWNGSYKLYGSEILEADIAAEHFLRDELLSYASFEELLAAYAEQIPLEELTPLKGQQLFNPRFN